ncbi:MAG TPA: serine hydrolase domain-containing protein [Gammaproteobacteria bacterium]|nr:serine hydrolase domain-containing protein [Gammaproteobacteria bacterium]
MQKKNVLNVWTALACAALLWLVQPAMAAESVVAGLSAERLDRLDALLEREIGAGRISGMVVAVARHGEAVQRTYGYMNLETREKMRDDALFRLYSMTKPVASVALLTLYEQGLFHLTDPLDKYIPQFANLKVYAGKDASGSPILEAPKRKPTIQDAFRHTLGLSGGLGNTDVDALYREVGLGMFELESVSQEMDRLAQVPLRYSPGDQWVYGLGHDVQAYLVEVFSGMKYADYVQKTIFDPLGMRSTAFGVPPAMKARFATVYSRGADGKLVPDTADRYARFTDHAFGTLSLSGSAPDYLRFAQMLLNGGELDGVRILGRKTVQLMSQNHLPPNIPSIAANGPAARGYGLGVSVTLSTSALGRPGSVGSFGWGGAATTVFTVDPAEDMAIVIMGQVLPSDDDLLRKVETLVYQALVDAPQP